MTPASIHVAAPQPARAGGRYRLAAAGDWLRRHQSAVRRLQWGVVAVYAGLLIVPAMVSLPDNAAHIWNDVSLFARFVFWGIWWPGVLVSVLLFGRLWCGIFCPEGALTEAASKRGLGRAIPRWLRWPGWPFTAFVLTTVYGQMVSVYQYPLPALLILGGSTVAAILVGYLYGRGHRVWCRYLCPVSGVFGVLAKLAPVHYRVDHAEWDQCPPRLGRTLRVACAPMVPLRTMESASPCHMCGRCSGFRNAIELAARPPGSEIIDVSARTATLWDTLLIVPGLMGVAVGAFHWASSPWFVALKQRAAVWLVGNGVTWPLEQSLPWWLLTNYSARNDVLSILDGIMLLFYIVATAVAASLAIFLPLMLAVHMIGPWSWQRFHHLVHGLLPLAACGVILGLSAQTVTLLRTDGFRLAWANDARMAALALSAAWSLLLIWKITERCRGGIRRAAATVLGGLAIGAGVLPWVFLFWLW